MGYTAALQEQLEANGLPPGAVAFLLRVWRVTQFFDDIEDGDLPEGDAFQAAVMDCLVGLPTDPFYAAHAPALSPVIALSIAKWRAANVVEALGQADERSFVWRAGFYDLVLLCGMITGAIPRDTDAARLLSIYGETFKEYSREFAHA